MGMPSGLTLLWIIAVTAAFFIGSKAGPQLWASNSWARMKGWISKKSDTPPSSSP